MVVSARNPAATAEGGEVMEKPNNHCAIGTYEHQVPMAIKGRRREIDLCIADIVAALNAANIITEASCCGHGKFMGNILLEDGRTIEIKWGETGWRDRAKGEKERKQ